MAADDELKRLVETADAARRRQGPRTRGLDGLTAAVAPRASSRPMERLEWLRDRFESVERILHTETEPRRSRLLSDEIAEAIRLTPPAAATA